MRERTAVQDRFDHDKNGRLDAEERKEARAWLKENRPQRGRGPGGRGGPPGMGPGGEQAADSHGKQGGKLAPKDVPSHADVPLFSPDVVRTFFFTFDSDDWFERAYGLLRHRGGDVRPVPRARAAARRLARRDEVCCRAEGPLRLAPRRARASGVPASAGGVASGATRRRAASARCVAESTPGGPTRGARGGAIRN